MLEHGTMKALLLAGGHGTRLRPLTYTTNKHVLPLGNKPMILYAIEDIIEAGIKDVGIVLGPVKEGIKELLGDGSRYGINITYIEQPEPLGIAHAVKISKQFIAGDKFVLYLGDNFLKGGIKNSLNLFLEHNYDALIHLTKVKDPRLYGVVELDGDKIKRLIEKPSEPKSNLVITGIYFLNEKIFNVIEKLTPSARNELEITDALQKMIEDGHEVKHVFVDDWWKDTGTPDDLLEANRLILHDIKPNILGTVEDGAYIIGNVFIDEKTTVRSGATIRGPVVIGKNCEIEKGVYIGPYTSIGDGTIIKSGEIENCIIFDNVHIDCNKRLSDSLIGRQVKILNLEERVPKTTKLIVGEKSLLTL